MTRLLFFPLDRCGARDRAKALKDLASYGYEPAYEDSWVALANSNGKRIADELADWLRKGVRNDESK